MHRQYLAIAAVTLSAAAGMAQGAEWTQASSLKDLPDGVRQGLASQVTGVIADRGEPFNASCVVDNRPGKRFMVGAVSADQVLVTIEHGGRGHGSKVLVFQRQGDSWGYAGERSGVGFPTTMQPLLTAVPLASTR